MVVEREMRKSSRLKMGVLVTDNGEDEQHNSVEGTSSQDDEEIPELPEIQDLSEYDLFDDE